MNRNPAAPPMTPWRLVRSKGSESMRWECVDGRWVTVTIGDGPEIGQVILEDSAGRRELLRTFEAALSLANVWRTPPERPQGRR